MISVENIEGAARTDAGRVRSRNEDYVLLSAEEVPGIDGRHRVFCFVADGVGGSRGGEFASRRAVEVASRHLAGIKDREDPVARLIESIELANAELLKSTSDMVNGSIAATTMVAAIVTEDSAVIANVGDSRAYLMRNGTVRQITEDHSLVASLVASGAISEAEALRHPHRNVILHCLGSEPEPTVDLFEVDLQPGDSLCLCSDGLTRHLNDSEIARHVSGATVAAAVDAMIEQANARGGFDNISAAVVKIRSERQGKDESLQPLGVGQDGKLPLGLELGIYLAVLMVLMQLVIEKFTSN